MPNPMVNGRRLPARPRLRRLFGRLLRRLRPASWDRDFDRLGRVGVGVTYDPGFAVRHGHANIHIGDNVHLVDALLSAGSREGRIVIESDVFFGHRVQVLARGHDYTQTGRARQEAVVERPITIREGAWIASSAIVLGGVEIGRHSVVAAGAVVVKDVPPGTIVGGNPARVLKRIDALETAAGDAADG